MKRIAIIPARGGSKRVPRKNIRDFLGRPMIEWPIAAIRASGLFDRIVVSTDDAEIAAIARQAGADVPFLRSPDLADDHSGVTEVVRDVLRRLYLDAGLPVPEMACLVYATAALLRPDDLRSAADRLAERPDADFVLSVASFPAPVQRALGLRNDRLEMMAPANLLVRSQDLEEAYHDAGQFCLGRGPAWLASARVFEATTLPLVIPRHRVQDIDTPEDWVRAEHLARALAQADR